jgi:prepilin-type N-terminal cleavage/methylation domain-containing protein
MRKALTLIETLVVIVIVGVVLGLALPAIQKVRAHAATVECLNKLRQVSLAIHNYAGDRAGQMPSVDAGVNPNALSLHFEILPYLEHGSYFAEVNSGKRPRGGNYTMKQYLCSLDPSLPLTRDSLASFAANAMLYRGKANHGSAIPDGLSNTLAFAEHYAFPPVPAGGRTQFSWYIESFEPIPGEFVRRATFADNLLGDIVPDTSGVPPVSQASASSGLTFQLRPALALCDTRIAQTAHHGGMPTAFADGSARVLGGKISETVYWALVTPKGGESISDDW